MSFSHNNSSCCVQLSGSTSHGQGEGSAGGKFRVSGTQETVEGAGANKVSGVPTKVGCLAARSRLYTKKEDDL